MGPPRGAGKRGGKPSGPQISPAEREAFQRIVALYRKEDYAAALQAADEAVIRFPKFGDGWNLKGVMLNNLSRPKDAIAAFEEARRWGASVEAVCINLAKSYLAVGDTVRSAEAARGAMRINPKGLEGALALARARQRSGDHTGALQALQPALMANPGAPALREFKARLLMQMGRHEDALKDLDIVVKASPQVGYRLDRAWLLISMGRQDEGLEDLEAILADNPGSAEALRAMADYHFHHREDRETANDFYRRSLAVRFDISAAGQLAFSLLATRGEKEAANVQEAHDLMARCIDAGQFDVRASKNMVSAFVHTADFERLSKIDLWHCADVWAKSNSPGGLHDLLARVKTHEDRVRLLGFHRLWGDLMVKRAGLSQPLPAPPIHAARSKIRIGIMSSDLRNHPVTYFALPIFENFDRDRFEIYCYSFYPREPDAVQRHIMSRVTSFKTILGSTDRDVAAQMQADDLDIIFELGGSTHLNRISVLAYRVSPIQVSWLGYPNSIGLPTIDYILVDPYIKPAPDLLIEKPFVMPSSWVSLSRLGFHDTETVNPEPPSARNGYITFGTANNPMKYTPGLLALWARVMREVDGSKFLFVRPEGDVPAFRKHILDAFAAGGIREDRIQFRPIRGQHRPHYNDMDISLDCIPHTGGTTTCEALWMGVPVVTRIGEAFYERLSYSNLANAGLKDLCANSEDDYFNLAVTLANDRPGIAGIRQSLRGYIKASPLGDTVGWVRDWQDVITSLVKGRAAI